MSWSFERSWGPWYVSQLGKRLIKVEQTARMQEDNMVKPVQWVGWDRGVDWWYVKPMKSNLDVCDLDVDW